MGGGSEQDGGSGQGGLEDRSGEENREKVQHLWTMDVPGWGHTAQK